MKHKSLSLSAPEWFSSRRWNGRGIYPALAFVSCVVLLTSVAMGGTREGDHRVSGAGRTIIEGGTGGDTPVPVTTIVAFHADIHGGDFECLALAPAQITGAGSGQFTVNAMYVTGKVKSLDVSGEIAVLRGTATVTGLGAGKDLPFEVRVHGGEPGATIELDVSGLSFREILLEGHININ